MVAIAQLVEHLIVVQKVARSSRVSHPTKPGIPLVSRVFCFRMNSLATLPRVTTMCAVSMQVHRCRNSQVWHHFAR